MVNMYGRIISLITYIHACMYMQLQYFIYVYISNVEYKLIINHLINDAAQDLIQVIYPGCTSLLLKLERNNRSFVVSSK